jgi:DNA-binding MarR family transcriptional regulator
MTQTETYRRGTTDKKAKGWEKFKQDQTWAAGSEIPLMMRLKRVSHHMTQRLEEMLGISTPQIRILFEAQDPEGISQSALHKEYKVDPASITRTVQAMERDGLVTRRPDAKDNRLMRVYITEKGRKLTENLPARLAQFEQEMVQDFSVEEIKQLHSLLERIEKQFGPQPENEQEREQ